MDNDRANFKALLKEFSTLLDAFSATNGKTYKLSAFLPADITVMGWNDRELFYYLDFGNIQGYNLHGVWDAGLIGHQGNLYYDPADTRAADKRSSVDRSVREYLNAGIAPAQLGLGLAAYGRGWQGAMSLNAWAPATGTAPGTWERGNEDYDKLKTFGTGYFDAAVGAAWRYDGNQWCSYDDTRSVAQKASYIVQNRLAGGVRCELSGDRRGELIGTLADGLRVAVPGGATDPVNPTGPTCAAE